MMYILRRVFGGNKPKALLIFVGVVGFLLLMIYVGSDTQQQAEDRSDGLEGGVATSEVDDGEESEESEESDGPLGVRSILNPRFSYYTIPITDPPIPQPPPRLDIRGLSIAKAEATATAESKAEAEAESKAATAVAVAEAAAAAENTTAEEVLDDVVLPTHEENGGVDLGGHSRSGYVTNGLVPAPPSSAVINCYAIADAEDVENCLGWNQVEAVEELFLDTSNASVGVEGANTLPERPEYHGYESNPKLSVATSPTTEITLESRTFGWDVFRKSLAEKVLAPPHAVKVQEWMSAQHSFTLPSAIRLQGDRIGLLVESMVSPFSSDLNYTVRIYIEDFPEIDEAPPKDVIFIVDASESGRGIVEHAAALLASQVNSQDRVGIISGNMGVILRPSEYTDYSSVADSLRMSSLRPGTSKEKFSQESSKRPIQVIWLSDQGDIPSEKFRQLATVIGDEYELNPGNAVAVMIGKESLGLTVSAEVPTVSIYSRQGLIDFVKGQSLSLLNDPVQNLRLLVEFNPQVVKSYRLLGYADRAEGFTSEGSPADLFLGSSSVLYEVELEEGQHLSSAVAGSVSIKWDEHRAGQGSLTQNIPAGVFHQGSDTPSASMAHVVAVAELAELMGKSYWACSLEHRGSLADTVDFLKTNGSGDLLP